jgi:hypothetical protein
MVCVPWNQAKTDLLAMRVVRLVSEEMLFPKLPKNCVVACAVVIFHVASFTWGEVVEFVSECDDVPGYSCFILRRCFNFWRLFSLPRSEIQANATNEAGADLLRAYE